MNNTVDDDGFPPFEVVFWDNEKRQGHAIVQAQSFHELKAAVEAMECPPWEKNDWNE